MNSRAARVTAVIVVSCAGLTAAAMTPAAGARVGNSVHPATAITTRTAGPGPSVAARTGATVTVAENKPRHAVPPRYLGLSIDPANACYVVHLAKTDPAFVRVLRNLGQGTLRLGGNTGDRTASWSETGAPSCVWNDDHVTPKLVNSFFAFARSAGYRVIWQVPLHNNLFAEDAAEAAYVSAKHGHDLDSIEIGNEPNLYNNAATKYGAYISEWATVYRDYRADGGSAMVSGPATGNAGSFYAIDFLKREAARIGALTLHYYVGNEKADPTCGDLLSFSHLNPVTRRDVALGKSHHLPFIMNETNTYVPYGEPGVSNAFCSALWAADYMLDGLRNGVRGMYFHGTADYTLGNTNGEPQIYTPINENGTPAPEYYGLLFYHEMAKGGGTQVAATTANVSDFHAYAIATGYGGLKLALFNLNPAQQTVTISTVNSYDRASELTLTAPSLTALSGVRFGGASVTAAGTWTPHSRPVAVSGTTSAITVPADTAVVVTYSR